MGEHTGWLGVDIYFKCDRCGNTFHNSVIHGRIEKNCIPCRRIIRKRTVELADERRKNRDNQTL